MLFKAKNYIQQHYKNTMKISRINFLGNKTYVIGHQNPDSDSVLSAIAQAALENKLNPQDILDRNRPAIGASPEINATEINLNIQYGDMLKIENFKGDNPDEVAKIVAKQFEKHTKDLNNALRKYTRG